MTRHTPLLPLPFQVQVHGAGLEALIADETERLTLAYVPVIKSLTAEVEELKAELRVARGREEGEDGCGQD
jgi:hypothetical protein